MLYIIHGYMDFTWIHVSYSFTTFLHVRNRFKQVAINEITLASLKQWQNYVGVWGHSPTGLSLVYRTTMYVYRTTSSS